MYPKGKPRKIPTPCKVTLVLTMCEKSSPLTSVVPKHLQELKFSFERQYNQTLTLIKSLVISLQHSKIEGISGEEERRKLRDAVHLEVIIISNNKESVNDLITTVQSWDSRLTHNLHLVFQKAIYLKGYEWMQPHYAPCSTLRLLLPQLLPHLDTVIYTDTDILFFQHIHDLWNQLSHFTPETHIGIVRSRRQFNVRPLVQRMGLVKIPAYNSGVMLMNLTRLRQDSDWKAWLVNGSRNFQEFLQWADQDILDVYFHFFPKRVYALPCIWNFVPPFFVNQTLCNPTNTGASILHGISRHFFKGGRIGLIYKSFEGLHLKPTYRPFSIEKFIQDCKQELSRTQICQVYDDIHNCDDNYFNDAITKKLESFLNKQNTTSDGLHNENGTSSVPLNRL